MRARDAVVGRRRLLPWVVAASAALGVVAAGCGAPPPRSAPARPATTKAAAAMARHVVDDALARGWAHVTIRSSLSATNGSTKESFSDISGPTRGRQAITVGRLSGSVILVAHIAYVRGSAGALFGIFDIPASSAERLAGRWVEITSRDEEYSSVTTGLTLASVMHASTPEAPVSLRRAALDGRTVLELSGGLPAGAGLGSGRIHLYATDTDAPLPLQVVADGVDGRETEVFGQLGAPADVDRPLHAESLPAAAQSGGGAILAVAREPVRLSRP